MALQLLQRLTGLENVGIDAEWLKPQLCAGDRKAFILVKYWQISIVESILPALGCCHG